jgi:cytochrome c5
MKPFILFSLLLMLLIACQRKSLPAITERKTEPPLKIASAYPPAMTVKPDTVQGKSIFIARCGRCHALPSPAQFNVTRWGTILSSMVTRARLDNEQIVHLQAYILANAAK